MPLPWMSQSDLLLHQLPQLSHLQYINLYLTQNIVWNKPVLRKEYTDLIWKWKILEWSFSYSHSRTLYLYLNCGIAHRGMYDVDLNYSRVNHFLNSLQIVRNVQISQRLAASENHCLHVCHNISYIHVYKLLRLLISTPVIKRMLVKFQGYCLKVLNATSKSSFL